MYYSIINSEILLNSSFAEVVLTHFKFTVYKEPGKKCT